MNPSMASTEDAGLGNNRGATRVALVANPESGGGDSAVVERELTRLGAEVTPIAIEDAPKAGLDDEERVIVAGGDGSIGSAAELAARTSRPLGVVPVGTANDFAQVFGLPAALQEACALALRGDRTKRLELARCDGRPFVNVASIGLPPAAARRAIGLKGLLGPLAYAAGALRAGLQADPVACALTGAEGEEIYTGEVWQATIASSGAFGAGAQLEADPTDGLLDAVIVEAGPRIKLIRRAQGMRAGSLEEQKGVRHARSREFTLAGGEEVTLNVDGEVVTRAGPVRFAVSPDAVEVVVG